MPVADWVKAIVAEVMPSKMAVGKILKHPDGRTVQIVNGRLWAEDGFTNYWSWREVHEDGSLGAEESGYGW